MSIQYANTGNVQSGEYDILVKPKYPTATKRGILYVHGDETGSGGGGSGAFGWQNQLNRAKLVNFLADAGHFVLSADLGGNGTWGNNTVIARIGAAVTYLLSLGVLSSQVAILCSSMGTIGSLAYFAANNTKATCLVGLLPCLDLTDIHTNNRGGYTAAINTAYSTYSEATYGATHNPQTMAAAGAFAALPIQLWYGSTDSIALPATATAFASTVGANCIANQVTGAHAESTYGLMSPQAILNFIVAAG